MTRFVLAEQSLAHCLTPGVEAVVFDLLVLKME
jgi:hypothetical protein